MRAFISLKVPEEVKDKAERLQAEMPREGLLFVRRPAMHITLQFLGEMSPEDLDRAKAAMQTIKFKPFRISISGVSYFSPDFIKVVFAKVGEGDAELRELYLKVCDALSSASVPFEKEDYTPHFTIARVKHVRKREDLIDAISMLSSAELGSFDAKSLFLMQSDLTPEGPVYTDLYELQL
jgi:RNA 2',3'-cyclic 3'-phosphodiesterase